MNRKKSIIEVNTNTKRKMHAKIAKLISGGHILTKEISSIEHPCF